MDKPVSLDTILDGEVLAQFQNAHEEVLENIMDIATNWKPKRKITVEIVYQCRDESREQVDVVLAKVKPTVEPQKSVGQALSIGMERHEGEMKPVAYAMFTKNKNQKEIFSGKDDE